MNDPKPQELTVVLYFDIGDWVPSEEEVTAMMNAEVLLYERISVEEEE